MWRTPAGVTEDDKLTRTETRTVLLRSIRMASKFKWWGIATAVLVTVSVVFTLAGPLLVRHGIDAGIRAKDAGALNAAVIGYFIVTVCAYVSLCSFHAPRSSPPSPTRRARDHAGRFGLERRRQ